jgi:hypothetical protein
MHAINFGPPTGDAYESTVNIASVGYAGIAPLIGERAIEGEAPAPVAPEENSGSEVPTPRFPGRFACPSSRE